MKRGLCPYDDKRYLLADLPDGSPNPNSHAYGHKDLAMEEQFAAVMPEAPGTDLVVENRERRYIHKHARVVIKLRSLPDGHRGDQEGEEMAAAAVAAEIPSDVALATGDWDLAAQAAARRPGVPGRVDDVLQRLFAAGMPLATTPLAGDVPASGGSPYSLQDTRSGPSGTHHPEPNAKRAQLYSSDDDDDDEDEPVPRRRMRGRNQFVLDEAAEDDEDDEDDEMEDCSLDE